MPRPVKWGMLGASTITLSKDIDKCASMCGSNFYETDVNITNIECFDLFAVMSRMIIRLEHQTQDWYCITCEPKSSLR